MEADPAVGARQGAAARGAPGNAAAAAAQVAPAPAMRVGTTPDFR